LPKIEIEVRNVGSESSWKEEYDCSASDPLAWANELVNKFNATLHPGERAREIIQVVVLDTEVEAPDHVWRKQNLITIIRGSQAYDVMRCERCGITAKRFGLSGVVRDSKYKAKKYIKCTKNTD
jgi:hypothetical protein